MNHYWYYYPQNNFYGAESFLVFRLFYNYRMIVGIYAKKKVGFTTQKSSYINTNIDKRKYQSISLKIYNINAVK